MTPPNYFRWVKVNDADSGESYDGYTLELGETFDNASWRIGSYTANYGSDLKLTETFDDTTSWRIGSYTANYGSDLKLTETFESSWPDLS